MAEEEEKTEETTEEVLNQDQKAPSGWKLQNRSSH